MNKIPIKFSDPINDYNIYIGNGLSNSINQYFNVDRNILIVTDDNIPSTYINIVKRQINNSYVLTLKHGEINKNFDNYKNILKSLIDNNFNRFDAIIAIGGGMIGDMAAFAASTYMRGIDFYNIPTTLLSQVDSSIGGKTAIDYMNVKNIVGTFYQPKAVLIDTDTLKSLPKRELYSGLVESIKMSATFDSVFFEYLLNCDDITKNIEYIIHTSILLKKMVVEKDEKEKDLRKVLNFGHTVGHAIEETMDLKLLHGECVGIGMTFFSSNKVKASIINILEKYNLPTNCNFDKNKVIELIKHDKKSNANTISVIKVDEIGSYKIINMTIEDIEKLL